MASGDILIVSSFFNFYLVQLSTSKEIGSLARQSRKDQGLTQLELANRVGVSRDWIIRR